MTVPALTTGTDRAINARNHGHWLLTMATRIRIREDLALRETVVAAECDAHRWVDAEATVPCRSKSRPRT